MNVSSHKIALLWAIALLRSDLSMVAVAGVRGLIGGRPEEERELNSEPLVCRITTFETMYEAAGDEEGDIYETEATVCIPFYDNRESGQLLSITLPNDIAESHSLSIAKGKLIVSIEGAVIRNNVVLLDDGASVAVLEDVPSYSRHLHPQEPATGKKSLMIVRVSLTDASPDYTLKQFRGRVFSQKMGLKKQYENCSFGKLQWKDAGGMELQLDQPTSSFADTSSVATAASEKIEKDGLGPPSELADFVMYCFPSGEWSGTWIAGSTVGGFLSVYKSEWCMSLTATMHEVGHGLGLHHAGFGEGEYADDTDYMGWADLFQAKPLKCFNGVHNWNLQWFKTRRLQADPYTPSLVKLATFLDFQKTALDEPVLVKISDKYVLQYNRKKGFNKGTASFPDMVTVAEDWGERTNLTGGLNFASPTWTVDDYEGSGRQLVVEACDIYFGNASSPDVMLLSIGLDESLCGNRRVFDTPLYINSGGPSKGQWIADGPFVTGGIASSTNAGITGLGTDFVYRTERHGNFKVRVPLENGEYLVILRFAETFQDEVGWRMFDVYVQGVLVLDDLDVYSQVGKNAAYVFQTFATVTNGRLEIEFQSVVDNAMVSGVEIYSSSPDAPDQGEERTQEPSNDNSISMPLYINAGGPTLVYDGIQWVEDTSFASGGRIYSTTASIVDTNVELIYQTERYGDFSYRILLENGDYAVRLHFAEIYEYHNTTGWRVFDVYIQNSLVYDNLDVFDVTGGQNKALVLENAVSVTDGSLEIVLQSVVENAKISGIEVYSAAQGGNGLTSTAAGTPTDGEPTVDAKALDATPPSSSSTSEGATHGVLLCCMSVMAVAMLLFLP